MELWDWAKLVGFVAAIPGFVIILLGGALGFLMHVASYLLALALVVVLPLGFLVWLGEVIIDLVRHRRRRR